MQVHKVPNSKTCTDASPTRGDRVQHRFSRRLPFVQRITTISAASGKLSPVSRANLDTGDQWISALVDLSRVLLMLSYEVNHLP